MGPNGHINSLVAIGQQAEKIAAFLAR